MTPGGRSSLLICLWLLTVLAPCPAPASAAPNPPTQQFLAASDIHFNPMADASLVDALVAADPTKWESILNRSQSTAFSQYGEDTNWWLLRSSFDAMRATDPHPAFILVTGDLLAHNFPVKFRQATKNNDLQVYRKFIDSTIKFLSIQLRKRYPHTPILLSPGNNDDDCGNYGIEAGGPFLQDTAALAQHLANANDDFLDPWRKLGSFDVPHPALRGVRILSLNTVFFSNKYQAVNFSKNCAKVPSTAPAEMFQWLREHLDRARQAHEKIWLMFHIPPGMDGFSSIANYESRLKTGRPPAEVCPSSPVPLWDPKWTTQLDQLLEEYAGTVVAAIGGHTHADDFRLLNHGRPGATFVLIDPPISPIYNQNPAFRVATFRNDASLSDSSVYYLSNLLYASKSTPGEWQREYTFSQTWKVQGINTGSLASIYSRVLNDGDARSEYLKLYNVSSAAVHLPPGTTAGLYCAIEGLNTETYGKCFCPTVTKPGSSKPAASGKAE